VLHKIAETEKITADPERAEKEIKAVLEHYPDADLNRVRNYVESMLVNEKVFDLLVGKK
jgi:FKBP-type peptidyl-prolyl cis-trans isomerase (trigger factor)